jgi:uncharacterized membrane protein YeiH
LKPHVSFSLLGHVLDLLGTFAFAISGATEGVRHGFDLFGVFVLAFVTAVSGGILRDLLIGAVPPAALLSWHYLAAALLAGLLTFRFSRVILRMQHPVQLFDAMGLSLFAVVGANKALAYGLAWPISAILGMLSGIGGGMVRDVLCAQVPGVLRAEVYAIAALAGALVVALGSLLPLPPALFTVVGAIVCLLLRLFGIRHRWNLPAAR